MDPIQVMPSGAALRGFVRDAGPALAPAATRVRAADPDLVLVIPARAGDADAFRALVERHRDRAYALALRVLRSPEDAEEAAQDAFVRAWRALPAFRGEAAFATWLHRIVLRVALDRAGSLKTRRERERALDPAGEPAAAAAPPERSAFAACLERLLDALTPAQRAVITLHYWQGCPVSDIAWALDMPENTVKTHLRRARLGLREAWPEDV